MKNKQSSMMAVFTGECNNAINGRENGKRGPFDDKKSVRRSGGRLRIRGACSPVQGEGCPWAPSPTRKNRGLGVRAHIGQGLRRVAYSEAIQRLRVQVFRAVRQRV